MSRFAPNYSRRFKQCQFLRLKTNTLPNPFYVNDEFYKNQNGHFSDLFFAFLRRPAK
jgi:hypothetical protein